MNLWILSQDGRHFFQNPKLSIETMNSYWYIFDEDTQTILGKYESEERAKEVIKDIVNMMIIDFDTSGTFDAVDICIKTKMLETMVKVYEMPKD